MNFLVCSLTNLPTSDAVYNKRNKLTYDKVRLGEWLKETNVCPVSKIEIKSADLLPVKPEVSVDDYIYANGSLPYTDLLLSDLISYTNEVKLVSEHLNTLSKELVSELIEKQACNDIISNLKGEIEFYKGEFAKIHKLENKKLEVENWVGFRSEISSLYSKLVEKNKQSKRNSKFNDKDILYKYKNFVLNRLCLSKPILRYYSSNFGHFSIFIDQDNKLVFVDIEKNYILDSIEVDFFCDETSFCILSEDAGDTMITWLHDNAVFQYKFPQKQKRLLKLQENFAIDQYDVQLGLLHPSAKYFLLQSKCEIVFISSDSLKTSATIKFDSGITSTDIHPDGKLLSIVLQDKPESVQIFDIIENKIMTSFTYSQERVHSTVFSGDRFHFYIRQDFFTHIIDIRKLEAVYSCESEKAISIKFNPAGTLLGLLFEDRFEVHSPRFKQKLTSVDLPNVLPIDLQFSLTANIIKIICSSAILIFTFAE
jgi:hypothetical protein